MENYGYCLTYHRDSREAEVVQKFHLASVEAQKVQAWQVGENVLLSVFGDVFVLLEIYQN